MSKHYLFTSLRVLCKLEEVTSLNKCHPAITERQTPSCVHVPSKLKKLVMSSFCNTNIDILTQLCTQEKKKTALM